MRKGWMGFAVVGCGALAALGGCSAPEGGGAPAAGGGEGGATFASVISPIAEQRCAKCHLEDKKGGLSLASRDAALAGGKKGGDIVPGDAENSLLYKMVAGKADKRMPPKGDPLSDADIATIKAWIDRGAL